ncbi:hypothetical protein DXG03_002057 [Asterophora parasitica]|uniref:Protein kinase domain-containing protein n=1 Tax=Asterophora parasitica TaxID=117018 RepID=A0A9P7KCG0_9AGAR|nr:hypothetical protein DXG03_002057 [Asterophora parasitica]
MDDSNENLMGVDDGMEETQQTQSTQQASQQVNPVVDAHLWGYLQPCSAKLTRIDFWKIKPRYAIGRNQELNGVVLPGFKINGSKVGRGQTRILREGNEIAFGTSVPQHHNEGLEDYRFIYRHVAGGPPSTGLYAFYDLAEELGKGSFATVMKAMCRRTGQWVAVKMIQEGRNVRSPGDQPPRPRSDIYMREISILERLKHPNICELKEVFFQEGSNDINLVLELIEGGDLLDFILTHNGLSEPMAQHITYQLCDALSYIHSQQVTHRDLKPENVLLTKDNPPIVKVADFGLAKFVDSLTMLRTMCGTPSYLAPEVVRQEHSEGYDNLVDSWSVGVIVFSMLTNASPFIEDDTQRDIRTRVSERTIDWGTLANGNISEEAREFIQLLLEDSPRDRMTLTDALQHPWLTSYTRVYDHDGVDVLHNEPPTTDSSMISATSSVDSFRNSVNEGFQNMHIQPGSSVPAVPGAFPDAGPSNGAGTSNVNREGSKTAPLQRGSHVLQKAAEEGKQIPEPSWEMLAHAAAQQQHDQAAAAGPSNSNPNGKGPNKRVHSELTPLPEETSMDAVIDGSSPLSDVDPTPNNGKDSGDDNDSEGATPSTGRTTRGKGKAASTPAKKTTRGRAAKGADSTDETAAQPRRSTRHPQKVARHA